MDEQTLIPVIYRLFGVHQGYLTRDRVLIHSHNPSTLKKWRSATAALIFCMEKRGYFAKGSHDLVDTVIFIYYYNLLKYYSGFIWICKLQHFTNLKETAVFGYLPLLAMTQWLRHVRSLDFIQICVAYQTAMDFTIPSPGSFKLKSLS